MSRSPCFLILITKKRASSVSCSLCCLVRIRKKSASSVSCSPCFPIRIRQKQASSVSCSPYVSNRDHLQAALCALMQGYLQGQREKAASQSSTKPYVILLGHDRKVILETAVFLHGNVTATACFLQVLIDTVHLATQTLNLTILQ